MACQWSFAFGCVKVAFAKNSDLLVFSCYVLEDEAGVVKDMEWEARLLGGWSPERWDDSVFTPCV